MSVDELIPRARELAQEDGRVPSKSAIQKALSVSWPKAVEVFQALTAEAARERTERAAKRAQIAARRRAGKGSLARSARRWVHHRPRVWPELLEVDKIPADLVGKGATAGAKIPSPVARKRIVKWPLLLLAQPAFVAVWSGWVGLGEKTGFGVVHPLPGIADGFRLNTAITLPIGVETYGTYALYVALSGLVPARARRFAMWSAVASLLLGMGGQVAFHLMQTSGLSTAPWLITTTVSCLPVAVVGMGAALYHLVSSEPSEEETN